MEKTIKEWLETLPEPYRTEALENHNNAKPKDLAEALELAFKWHSNPQGLRHWIDIYTRAEAGEFNNSSLDKDSEK